MFFGRPKIDLSDDLRAAETQHYGQGHTGWEVKRRAEQAATAQRESELRSRLESLGASTSGRKTTLVKRLLDAERARLPIEERIPGLEFRWFHNCRHIFRNVTVDAFGETGRVPEPPREMWARSEYEHSSSDDD